MKQWILIPALAFTLTLFSGCASSPTGRNQLLLVSPEQAINASAEAYVETLKPFEKEGKVDSDPKTLGRVQLITGKIIAQAIQEYPQTKDWNWSVKVIDDPDNINAWCMAGGKMAIYTGLLNKVDPTDDELAQVMAHEVSHALSNHTAEKMSVALASQIGLIGVAIAADESKYRNLALTGAALAATYAIQMPNSRTAETEADRVGIELAAKAGYNPDAAVSLWHKMKKASGDGPPEFLSTHPAPETRIQALSILAPQMRPYYEENTPRPIYRFK